jgi:hypothetical protein
MSVAPSLTVGLLAACLPAEALHHALVNPACHADIVEIVFANLSEPAGVIKIKYLAAFDLGSLA